MSLINDALKRATKSSAEKPAEPGAPMRPAGAHQSIGLPRYFFPVLLCIFCGAMWFIVRGWDIRREAGLYPEPVTVNARPISRSSIASNPTEPAPLAPSPASDESTAIPAGRDFALDEDPAAAGPAGLVPGQRIQPAQPTPPGLRLQGIFYRPSGPSAVVNTKTVYVGDVVDGARVKAIGRDSITLELDGQSQVLTLR